MARIIAERRKEKRAEESTLRVSQVMRAAKKDSSFRKVMETQKELKDKTISRVLWYILVVPSLPYTICAPRINEPEI